MAETFSLSEFVIPGTFVRVRAEGLISVGGISSGNIGIAGTAQLVVGGANALDYARTYTPADYEDARAQLGNYDALSEGKFNLARALEVLFQNGARTVYARPLKLGAGDAQPGAADY